MLSFLSVTTRPNILFTIHQCTRFSTNPSKEHEEAVKRIGRYLKWKNSKGIILKSDISKNFEVYMDVDFARS